MVALIPEKPEVQSIVIGDKDDNDVYAGEVTFWCVALSKPNCTIATILDDDIFNCEPVGVYGLTNCTRHAVIRETMMVSCNVTYDGEDYHPDGGSDISIQIASPGKV